MPFSCLISCSESDLMMTSCHLLWVASFTAYSIARSSKLIVVVSLREDWWPSTRLPSASEVITLVPPLIDALSHAPLPLILIFPHSGGVHLSSWWSVFLLLWSLFVMSFTSHVSLANLSPRSKVEIVFDISFWWYARHLSFQICHANTFTLMFKKAPFDKLSLTKSMISFTH